MIIEQKIRIQLTGVNVKRFQKLGYDVKYLDIIEIEPKLLSMGSNLIVKYKCDICGCIDETTYKRYNNKRKIYEIDTCFKCSRFKTDQTNMKKYGCISPTQNVEVLKKR